MANENAGSVYVEIRMKLDSFQADVNKAANAITELSKAAGYAANDITKMPQCESFPLLLYSSANSASSVPPCEILPLLWYSSANSASLCDDLPDQVFLKSSIGFNFPARRAGIHEASIEQSIAKRKIKNTVFQSTIIGIVSR